MSVKTDQCRVQEIECSPQKDDYNLPNDGYLRSVQHLQSKPKGNVGSRNTFAMGAYLQPNEHYLRPAAPNYINDIDCLEAQHEPIDSTRIFYCFCGLTEVYDYETLLGPIMSHTFN